MGRQPLGDKYGMKKGNWSPDEDQVLLDYIKKHGPVNWKSISENTGLLRCGKSCRTRWKNYLDPDIKRGPFSSEEKATVIQLEGMLGNRWAAIAAQLPGRTDNDVKNFFRGHRKKRMNPGAKSLQINKCCSSSDIVNVKHESPSTQHMKQWESARVEAEARLSMESLLLNPSVSVKREYDYFLQLWNSEVGESFRNIKGKGREATEGSTSFSQALSSTKLDSTSVDNTIQAMAINTAGTTHGQDSKLTANAETSSAFISSTDFPASSDIPDCNFMEYLQGETESFNDFLGL